MLEYPYIYYLSAELFAARNLSGIELAVMELFLEGVQRCAMSDKTLSDVNFRFDRRSLLRCSVPTGAVSSTEMSDFLEEHRLVIAARTIGKAGNVYWDLQYTTLETVAL